MTTMPTPTALPLLFTPFKIRDITLPNRIVVPPMAQYCAIDGIANDFHLVHYGKFALGGAGIVFVEATGVASEGRITNGCLGLWNDAQAGALEPIVRMFKSHGTVPAIQIGHGGRKGGMQRPWHGNGPLNEQDIARGDKRWTPLAPSAVALADGWPVPREMDTTDLARTRDAFVAAAKRALSVGFEVIELHMAHGYLLHSFLSPLSNFRTDAYGGSLQGRMRFPLEVTEAVRAALPAGTPLFVRISAADGIDGGWTRDDSDALAHELRERGVDVIDCSSGGNTPRGATNANLQRAPGYQVPFATRIRNETSLMTEGVGLIRDPDFAERILQEGGADLIGIARQFLFDPFWALHAAHHFGIDPDFNRWPQQYAWWLEKWDKGIKARESIELA